MSVVPQILAVEHDAAVAVAIEASLARIGFPKVVVAHSAEQAFSLLDKGLRPDVALVDIKLPGPVDGVECADKMTSVYRLPVLYLTGSAQDLPYKGLRAKSGPYGYLVKPFREDEMRATLDLVLDSSETAFAKRDSPHVVAPLSDSEGVIITDLTGRITYLNTAAEDFTGWHLADALNLPYQEVFRLVDEGGYPVDHRPHDRDATDKATLKLARRSGGCMQIRERTTSLTDKRGSLTGLAIVFQETTHDEPEKATPFEGGKNGNLGLGAPDRNALARLTGIVEGIADPLFAMDEQWKITFVNERAEEHLGKKREDIIGSVFWDEFPDSVHSKYYYEYYKALTRQQTRDFEFYHEAKDRWLEAHAYPFSEGLLVFLRDVTERKKSQEQASKLDKLESLGLLARGFAHDFNNLLTVLLGNLSLASVQDPRDVNYRDALEAAKHASIQAQNLVQQLLTFAKGGAPIKEAADLNALLRDLQETRPKLAHIDYQLKLAKIPVRAEIDKGQFRRLLENLVQNAEEALPSGGTIVISSTAFQRENTQGIRLPNLDPNTQYVLIQVSDDGEGVPATNLEKVFEPYFSTRTDANATGLGLTVCDSIARAHKGFLTIDSRYQSHTRVNLFLPALHQTWQAKASQPTRRARISNDPPRILVLEDEKSISILIGMALRKEGYNVTLTDEGSKTVEVYRNALDAGQRFDLIIMDLSIPNGMGGAEAIQQILHLDPEVTAVVSSGYSDDPVMAQYQRYGFTAVLPKPYEPSALQKLVNTILKGSVENA